MSALFDEVRAALGRRKVKRGLVAVEIERALDPERLAANLLPRPARQDPFDAGVVWDTRGSETLDGELSVGLGIAAQTHELGEVAPMLGAIEGDAKKVRCFGGVAFDADDPGPFGAARFVVPRWCFSVRSSRGPCSFVVVVRPDDTDELDRLAEDARRIEAALSRVPAPLSSPASMIEDGAADFERLVVEAVAAIEQGSLEKVVVVRRARVRGSFAPGDVLARLATVAGCVRFGLATDEAAFVGATPEVLVSLDERGIRTEAIAGSEPRRGAELAEVARLLVRDKDRREHAFVVEAIRRSLEARGAEVSCGEPRIRTLTHVHHLVTPVSATAPGGANALDLAIDLHPTPAMGGVPAAAALAFLRLHEGAPRGLYAAPFGWTDATGHGAFVVGIRSALLGPGDATVYAGAGIVRGSVPSIELAETQAKMRGMLEALGAAEDRPARPRAGGPLRREAGA